MMYAKNLSSDLQRWPRQHRSVLSSPLSPPSSPALPHWLQKLSSQWDRSVPHCFGVSVAPWGGSHWRQICSGCRSNRWWYQSNPHHCPAPELSWNHKEKWGRKIRSQKQEMFFLRAYDCFTGLVPASEDVLVIQSPLCQVKSSLPGHQASGPLWDQSHVLQQTDGFTAGLQEDNNNTEILSWSIFTLHH